MKGNAMRPWAVCLAACLIASGTGATLTQSALDAIEAEALRHFQAILRLDTSNPPGNEGIVVEYLKGVQEQAGIETKTLALDPKRSNLVARLRGSGKKRPLLIMELVPTAGFATRPGAAPSRIVQELAMAR